MLKKNKGFTLVEVIVVLVILAILAAIMIPSMTGWITRAEDKSDLVECRAVLLACQTLVSESYAATPITTFDSDQLDEAKTLSGMSGTVTACSATGGTVTSVVYTASSGTSWTYDGTAWDHT